ncbi:MAG TPA: aerotolerance regulator BatC [Flavobacteriaceae bacterium]|nr:aerotolerance regulator BatC [Flavobacteriaceae bacterium]
MIIIFFFSINLFGQDESYNKNLYDGNINYDKDFLLAENSYRKAISINSSNIKAPYNLSNKYYEEGLYDEALIRQAEALKNANSSNEKHRINHNIGNILMKKDLCKEALEAYKDALRNNPNDDETRYNLSLAKLCADEQNKNNEKKDDQKDDQQKDDQKDDQQKDDQKDDQQKDNKQDQKNDNKNEQNDKKKNPSKDRGSAKLSPEQIKNLLKAMNNEENKVQAKINEKKQKGVKIVTEKDW